MTRGLKRVDSIGVNREGSTSSTECPYDEGTETVRAMRHRRRPRCSTECPYDEGTETG